MTAFRLAEVNLTLNSFMTFVTEKLYSQSAIVSFAFTDFVDQQLTAVRNIAQTLSINIFKDTLLEKFSNDTSDYGGGIMEKKIILLLITVIFFSLMSFFISVLTLYKVKDTSISELKRDVNHLREMKDDLKTKFESSETLYFHQYIDTQTLIRFFMANVSKRIENLEARIELLEEKRSEKRGRILPC